MNYGCGLRSQTPETYLVRIWRLDLADKPLGKFKTAPITDEEGHHNQVWQGSKRFSKDILLPEKNLAWVLNEPFDILGITFFVETQQIVEYNYRMKLEEVRKLLDSWSWRLLSIIGKIQVIKSLAIFKFVHLLKTLPTPNDSCFKELKLSFSPLFGVERVIK